MTGSGDTRSGRRTGLSRYDVVLAAIPLAFLAGLAATVALGVSVRAAMAVASALGAVAVVDALFVNPPSAA